MWFFLRCITGLQSFVAAGADGDKTVLLFRGSGRYVYLFRFLARVVIGFGFRLSAAVVSRGPIRASYTS